MAFMTATLAVPDEAVRYSEVSYLEVLAKGWRDGLDRHRHCRDNKLPIIVFNLNTPANNASSHGRTVGTVIH